MSTSAIEPARACAQLLIMNGSEAKRVLHLPESGSVDLGRSPQNELVIDEPTLSSRHARLTISDREIVLEDLGSTNGSYVNGRPLGRAVLRDGDVLRLGALDLLFRMPRVSETHSDGPTLVLSEPLGSRRRSGSAFQTDVAGPPANHALGDAEALNLLFEVGRLAHAAGEEERILRGVLEAIQRALRPDRVLVQLEDEEPGTTRYVAAAGLEDRVPRIPTQALDDVRRGRSVLMRFDRQRDRDAAGGTIHDQGIRSLLCVPVSHGEEHLGCLYLDLLTAGGGFDLRSVETLSAVADVLGASLVRCRSDRHAREVEQRLRDRENATLLGLLVAGIGHDLSNTLTALLGLAETAEDDPSRGERLPADVRRLGERGRRTIRSLLAVAGRSRERALAFDLDSIVQDVAQLLSGKLRQVGIEVVAASCGTPCLVVGNPGEVQDALLNACLASSHVMSAGGTLSLTVAPAPDHHVVRIDSAGAEAGAATLAALLHETVDISKGGFDLAHARRIVLAHGGRMEFEGTPGRGNRIEMHLPRAGSTKPMR